MQHAGTTAHGGIEQCWPRPNAGSTRDVIALADLEDRLFAGGQMVRLCTAPRPIEPIRKMPPTLSVVFDPAMPQQEWNTPNGVAEGTVSASDQERPLQFGRGENGIIFPFLSCCRHPLPSPRAGSGSTPRRNHGPDAALIVAPRSGSILESGISLPSLPEADQEVQSVSRMVCPADSAARGRCNAAESRAATTSHGSSPLRRPCDSVQNGGGVGGQS